MDGRAFPSVQLTEADLRGVDGALASVTMNGGRMSAEQMKVVETN